ncbi:charged multivesicular body protein 7 isoform X2 [Pieris napi]|uniref:charged multivesicular body protein 7 isoform X2 n=1 Tax=Pieris napi TaxID=78633 RepID=UPI001FBBE7C7|nr:charged multivesicular body protein 7 isoform X2 [Pieris napi]
MGLHDIGLPQDRLPHCWSDDVRMNALFAPFRLKSVNPESWEMKMKFWCDIVQQWCKYKKDPIISASDIKCAFQRKGRTAACIDIVVEEMFRNGDLCPLSKYPQILHNGTEGWMWWGAKLAFKPAALALTAVSSLLPARQSIDNDGLPKSNIDATQRFVLESAVKKLATELLNSYPPGVERIGTIEHHMKNTGNTNRETFELLLGYLVSQGAAVKQGDVVKLAEPNKKAAPVSEMDVALVKLITAEQKLCEDMSRLTKEVLMVDNDVRAALKLGNRLAAKNHLRRKHIAQKRVDKCESALHNVKQLLEQARDVDVNAAVVDTYRTSAKAMKSTMKEGGLEEDLVHDTMDDLKEVMDAYNEMGKALGGTIDDEDLNELEEELNELLSGPGGGDGGTPEKDKDFSPDVKLPSPPSVKPKRSSEREFVFDGEEQMLADLNQLGFDDTPRKDRVGVVVGETHSPKRKSKDSKWSQEKGNWSEKLDSNLQDLSQEYAEVRLDERLHPGQELKVDFTQSPRHFASDFQVRDHKSESGVWLFNSEDSRRADLATSTKYSRASSPGKSESSFLMAVGGERRPPSRSSPSPTTSPESSDSPPPPKDSPDEMQDLQKRLNNLRGF